MSAVAKMRQAGFELAITKRGGLWVEPASRLTDAQRAYIRANKVLLLAELRAETTPPPPVELDQEALEERAAILEFEAGFSRDEAERRALALMSAPPVDSAITPPVTKAEIVCCADCAHSVLPPDTCPVYGWRLCGLDIEGGGGFGRAVRRCDAWEVRT